MARERAVTALTILLAVVVVGTAAAGLADSQSSDGSVGAGLGSGNGSGVGQGNGTGIGFNSSMDGLQWGIPGWVLSRTLSTILIVALAVGVAAVVLYVLQAQFADLLDQLADATATAVAIVLLFGGILITLMLLAEILGEGGGGALGSQGTGPSSAGGQESADALETLAIPPTLVLAAGMVFVGLMVLLTRDGGSDAAAPAPEPVDADPSTPPARERRFRYHDSPADPAVVNEVYRAWETLASEVGATSATTPAEVERDAVAAGYDADAVDELTGLFREVRYGDQPVTEDRVRRAGSALDAIKSGRGRT